MAKPMTAAQWRAQLKKFGQKYRELPTFRNPESGRSSETGKEFGPVNGGLIHHTAGPDDKPNNADDAADSRVINQGRAGLPGPLAHAGATDDGVIELHTTDRANHAGNGDRDVYNAVVSEDYGDYPPRPDRDEVDGNDCLYGLEAYYTGTKPPKAAQYRAMVNWAAAFCDFHGWSPKSAIGHKEWTRRKIDPYGVDMAKFRRDVAARIRAVNTPPTKKSPWRTALDTVLGRTSITLQTVTANVCELPRHDKTIGATFTAAAAGCQLAGFQETGNPVYVRELCEALKNHQVHGQEGDPQHNVSMSFNKSLFRRVASGYRPHFDGESGISHSRHLLWVELELLEDPTKHIIVVVSHYPPAAFWPGGQQRTSGDRIPERVAMWKQAQAAEIKLLTELAAKGHPMVTFSDANRQKVSRLPATIADRKTHAISNALDWTIYIDGAKADWTPHEVVKVDIGSKGHPALQNRVTLRFRR